VVQRFPEERFRQRTAARVAGANEENVHRPEEA
jgi:hypothetical protein